MRLPRLQYVDVGVWLYLGSLVSGRPSPESQSTMRQADCEDFKAPWQVHDAY